MTDIPAHETLAGLIAILQDKDGAGKRTAEVIAREQSAAQKLIDAQRALKAADDARKEARQLRDEQARLHNEMHQRMAPREAQLDELIQTQTSLHQETVLQASDLKRRKDLFDRDSKIAAEKVEAAERGLAQERAEVEKQRQRLAQKEQQVDRMREQLQTRLNNIAQAAGVPLEQSV